jgi:hypothetical protein
MSDKSKGRSDKTRSPKATRAADDDVRPVQEDVYAAVSKAYDELEDLYDVSEGADSVQLFRALMEVSRLRTALNQSHLESRTGEYNAIKQSLGPILDELTSARQRIDRIIKVAATAARVAGYLDQAIKLSAKYFA